MKGRSGSLKQHSGTSPRALPSRPVTPKNLSPPRPTLLSRWCYGRAATQGMLYTRRGKPGLNGASANPPVPLRSTTRPARRNSRSMPRGRRAGHDHLVGHRVGTAWLGNLGTAARQTVTPSITQRKVETRFVFLLSQMRHMSSIQAVHMGMGIRGVTRGDE